MSRRMAVHVTKLCCLILAATVSYNEFLSYWLHATSWPRVPQSRESTTLLLVADPQILGEDHEPGGALGALRRWDGDRYLAKAYRCGTSWHLDWCINSIFYRHFGCHHVSQVGGLRLLPLHRDLPGGPD